MSNPIRKRLPNPEPPKYNKYWDIANPKQEPFKHLSELIAELEYAKKMIKSNERLNEWDKWYDRVNRIEEIIEERYSQYDEPKN